MKFYMVRDNEDNSIIQIFTSFDAAKLCAAQVQGNIEEVEAESLEPKIRHQNIVYRYCFYFLEQYEDDIVYLSNSYYCFREDDVDSDYDLIIDLTERDDKIALEKAAAFYEEQQYFIK